ncbi:unnamed protein product, partial [marine sediment metagenome]
EGGEIEVTRQVFQDATRLREGKPYGASPSPSYQEVLEWSKYKDMNGHVDTSRTWQMNFPLYSARWWAFISFSGHEAGYASWTTPVYGGSYFVTGGVKVQTYLRERLSEQTNPYLPRDPPWDMSPGRREWYYNGRYSDEFVMRGASLNAIHHETGQLVELLLPDVSPTETYAIQPYQIVYLTPLGVTSGNRVLFYAKGLYWNPISGWRNYAGTYFMDVATGDNLTFVSKAGSTPYSCPYPLATGHEGQTGVENRSIARGHFVDDETLFRADVGQFYRFNGEVYVGADSETLKGNLLAHGFSTY